MAVDSSEVVTTGQVVTSDEAAVEGTPASDASVRAALAGIANHGTLGGTHSKESRPGELKWQLTSYLFPSIILIFVALYVTSLASGMQPEMALLWAGGASVVLAILARVAVGILGDDSRHVLNDDQIVARARAEAAEDQLGGAEGDQGTAPGAGSANQPASAASAASTGGRE